MKKIYKVPAYKISDSFRLEKIDDIVVVKDVFGYKELFTHYRLVCFDTLIVDDKTTDIDLFSLPMGVENTHMNSNSIFIFSSHLTDNNLLDSDKVIDHYSKAPYSKWMSYYRTELKPKKKDEAKILKKLVKEVSGSFK